MLEPVPQWLYSFATHCRRRWAHVGNILRHDSANDFRCQRSLSHLTWVQFPQFPRPPPKRLSPVAVALWWSDLRELRSESYVPIWDPWAVGCGRCGRGPAAFAASLSRSCREHRIKWLKIYICAAYSIVLLLLPQGLMVEKLQPELLSFLIGLEFSQAPRSGILFHIRRTPTFAKMQKKTNYSAASRVKTDIELAKNEV